MFNKIQLNFYKVLEKEIVYFTGKDNCQAQSPNPKSQILKSKDLDFGWQ